MLVAVLMCRLLPRGRSSRLAAALTFACALAPATSLHPVWGGSLLEGEEDGIGRVAAEFDGLALDRVGLVPVRRVV